MTHTYEAGQAVRWAEHPDVGATVVALLDDGDLSAGRFDGGVGYVIETEAGQRVWLAQSVLVQEGEDA